MITSAQAHQGNLRRRNQQANSEVTCPCFDIVHDAALISTDTNGDSAIIEIDFNRDRSCLSNPKMNKIYWTPISAADRPDADIVMAIDGVKYNYLKTINDSERNLYSCERNDWRHDIITPEEAQACMDLMTTRCEDDLPQMCQTANLSDVESILTQVKSGEIVLDEERTCDTTSISYGLYAENVNLALASSDGTTHCDTIIQEACSQLDLLLIANENESIEAPVENSCVDDSSFVLHGNSIAGEIEAAINAITGVSSTIKNCAWVAEDSSRCGALSKGGDFDGKRAFEFCRNTCGTCKCADASNEDEKCCKDNKNNFRLMDGELKNCEWVARNATRRSFRCAKKAVAKNCPEACGFCPA